RGGADALHAGVGCYSRRAGAHQRFRGHLRGRDALAQRTDGVALRRARRGSRARAHRSARQPPLHPVREPSARGRARLPGEPPRRHLGVSGVVVAPAGARRGRCLGGGARRPLAGSRDPPAEGGGRGGAAVGAGAMVVAGLVTAGPGALAAFVRAVLQPANSPSAQMQGASGLFGSLLGSGAGAFGLSIAAGLGAALVAGWLGAVSRLRRDLLEPAFAGAIVLSLFASPHLLGHDLTL